MDWTEAVFNYCERGTDPGLLAEPVNVATSLALFLAAGLGYRRLMQQPSAARDTDCKIFIAFVVLMGVGSTLFHLFAQRWAFVADVGPIMIFILVYMNYALNRFLQFPPGLSLLLTGAFLATAPLIAMLPGGLGLMNGSVGFLPGWLVLLGVGWIMRAQGHPAGWMLLAGAAVFLVSLAFRTADRAVCELTNIAGHATGTHGLWHVLNAVLLYLLLRAAIDHGRHGEKTYEVLPPDGRPDAA